MKGDDRVRFCDHCQLNVYNLSGLSRGEAETLLAQTEGRLCARLFRRADGTVLTNDCPVGLRVLRKRVAKRTAAVFAAIASFAFTALGQDNSKTCIPQAKITRQQLDAKQTSPKISGTILDPNRAVIPYAKISLTNLKTRRSKTTRSDDNGRFEFGSLAEGSYSLKIEMPGFKNLIVKNMVLKDQIVSLDLVMEVSGEVETIGIVVSDSLDYSTSSTTTVIGERQIQTLPIPN
jgi:hypothetical protein